MLDGVRCSDRSPSRRASRISAIPGSAIDTSYPEVYIAPSYAVTPKLKVGLSAYYAPDYSRTGAWENYDLINAKYTFDSGVSVSGEFGHQSFCTAKATPIAAAYKIPDYDYWNFGASYNYKALTFDLRYFATRCRSKAASS